VHSHPATKLASRLRDRKHREKSFTDRGERKLGLREAELKRLVVCSLTSLPVVGESTVTGHNIKKHCFF